MFQLLLTAERVIADLSIHNANVFYELGVRHALRDKRTYLIRSKSDDVPFDLKTQRYLEYDRDHPGASKEDLAVAVFLIAPEPADAAAGLRESRDIVARVPGADIRFKYMQREAGNAR